MFQRMRMRMMSTMVRLLLLSVVLLLKPLALSFTDPKDYTILEEFRKGLENPEVVNWPIDDRDPCSSWRRIFCSGGRVTQIQVQNMGLRGSLPRNFNQLSMLSNLGLQRNHFHGDLPTFKGLSRLQYVYLDYNEFSMIPSDFFDGLTSLQAISLDANQLNSSTGWVLPAALENSAQLVNFSCSNCSLVGTIPDFLGGMPSLSSLRLGFNRLTGEIPASFRGSNLRVLTLDNQAGEGLSGSIHILATMPLLTQVWLHRNAFTGTIPETISLCTSLTTLLLDNNQLTGIVPQSMASLQNLEKLHLTNNKFVGPIPKLHINIESAGNSFCQKDPGVPCSPEVNALVDFLGGVEYPLDLAASWSGNDPCSSSWLGISCLSNRVSVINLPNHKLSGTINPLIGKLDSLSRINLDANNLSGPIPSDLTGLKLLKVLNLTSNNLSPPVPIFGNGVKLLIDQNPLLEASRGTPPSPGNNPPQSMPSPVPSSSPRGHLISPPDHGLSKLKGFAKFKMAVSVSSGLGAIVLAFLICLYLYRRYKESCRIDSNVLPPKDGYDPATMLKLTIANKTPAAFAGRDLCIGEKRNSRAMNNGSLVIPVEILRNVTRGFASENELGRGGFGIVYKGELDDGTTIAVKRMLAAVSNEALGEFHSEITVLSKVRHRNLVSLIGYSIEDRERLLVYEYMSQGALSKHLFQWIALNMEPLSWKKRLGIALDVARGMEYLHGLAQQCFIHRDLKSSNILLDGDYHAKVSDFGLVKLSPDGRNKSLATRLAGTFGYLAPEYAVTGRITTKVDVFSFGVVLMELVTGLRALDEDRPEESRYLASWFRDIGSNKERLRAAVDPCLDVTDETFESVCVMAELAGHCAAREPRQRPDMGYAVSVLGSLVDKWKPMKDEMEEFQGIDLKLPLRDMVKDWQEADGDSPQTLSSQGDSNASIPVAPNGIAHSLTYGR